MIEHSTISNAPPARTSMDFTALRKEAIRHLERLGTGIWTDFNLHDPGITILEILCFAITDLGYRANFPIEDLLASPDNDPAKYRQDFFSAREILPVNPVTPLDWRKVVIDTFIELVNDPYFHPELRDNCAGLESSKWVRAINNAWIYKADCVEPKAYLHETYSISGLPFDENCPEVTPLSEILAYLKGKLKRLLIYDRLALFGPREKEMLEQLMLSFEEKFNEVFPEAFATDNRRLHGMEELEGALQAANEHFFGLFLQELEKRYHEFIETFLSQEEQQEEFFAELIKKWNDGRPKRIGGIRKSILKSINQFQAKGQNLLAAKLKTRRLNGISGKTLRPIRKEVADELATEIHNTLQELALSRQSREMLKLRSRVKRKKINTLFPGSKLDLARTSPIGEDRINALRKRLRENQDTETLKDQKKKIEDALRNEILDSLSTETLDRFKDQVSGDVDDAENKSQISQAVAAHIFGGAQMRRKLFELLIRLEVSLDLVLKSPQDFDPTDHPDPLDEEIKKKIDEWRDLLMPLTKSDICQIIERLRENADLQLKYTEGRSASCPLQVRGLYTVCLDLVDWIDPQDVFLVNKVKEAVRTRFYAHRNLCEDLLEIEVLQNYKIGVCAELELEPDSRKNEVLADVLYHIQEFLNPTIPFYSLEELHARGISCEHIFNGPALAHGFLTDEELIHSTRRETIYRSDLLQVIMDVPGVLAVRSLKIASCQGENLNDEELGQACLSIPCKHKAVLDVDCSKVEFKIGTLFTRPDMEEVKEFLSLLHHVRKKPLPDPKQDVEIEPGRFRNLDRYYSVQDKFPAIYHIGTHGPPPAASPLRKAQAKQLQGFLLFFDQLLANYLAQLAEVRNLLSVQQIPADEQQDPPTSYFHLLDEETIAGFSDLLAAKSQNPHQDEDCVDNRKPLEYIASDLQQLLEDEVTRDGRRDRILDHLLARFGERFADYVIALYQSTTATRKSRGESLEAIMKAKAGFLQRLPELSSERGKGFNYKGLDCGNPDVWDTANVTGLKKRISLYMGMPSYNRVTLTCRPEYLVNEYSEKVDGKIKGYRYRLVDKRQRKPPLLVSAKRYRLKRNAVRDGRFLYELAMQEENYFIQDGDNLYQLPAELPDSGPEEIVYRLIIKDNEQKAVAQSPDLLNKEAVLALRKRLLELAYPEDCRNVGFHIVEHLLFWPPYTDDGLTLLQPFCLFPDCRVLDPYSFWITVIAPAWQEQFADSNRRFAFEQLLRRETPAHIGVRFLYLSSLDMYDFETLYHSWLIARVKFTKRERKVMERQNELVAWLNLWQHECSPAPGGNQRDMSCGKTQEEECGCQEKEEEKSRSKRETSNYEKRA